MFKHVIFLSMLLSLSLSTAFAAFPRGCEVTGFAYSGTNLIVNNQGDQTFYLIQNRSPEHVELRRLASPDDFMTPPLTAKIAPEHWAAFASDIQNFPFQCFTLQENNTAKVDCRDVLDICQYPRVKFALSNMGNYWVSVDKEQQQTIKEATGKGIYLRW